MLGISFIFISFCWHILCYNNFNELKKDMENKVDSIALAIEAILQTKCTISEFDCPVKSFNICEGTAQRQCLTHFPTSNSCNGLSKYSLTSGIRIPSSYASFALTDEINFNLCKTAEPPFENQLQKLIAQNQKNYAWLYFGFSDGSFRVSPGFKYEKQKTSESCRDYDPRLRPWYSSNVYSRKKMIILVQNSKRMYQHSTRNQTVKMALQALLKTGEEGDYFNVIQFSDSARCLITPNGQKDIKLVSLASQIASYNKKTGTEGQYYKALADNITQSATEEVNYKAALELATKILSNSRYQNGEYENFILMFAGFQPSNFSALNIKEDFEDFLRRKEHEMDVNLTFFSFGVDMVENRGKALLKNLSCSFNGIFFELSNIKYESQFLDQARGFYEYLSQGNEMIGHRWSSFYEDAFGLGRMTTVVKAAYYKEKNVSRLIGLAGIDVLVSQLTIYKSEADIKNDLSMTEKPFKRNISLCALETIRRNQRCYPSQQTLCENYRFCEPKLNPEVKSIIRSAEDESNDSCCPFEESTQVGLILGVTFGALLGMVLIGLMVYCLIFRRPHNLELQQTYIEIFSKFKDFDQTRIRADSETSLIRE